MQSRRLRSVETSMAAIVALLLLYAASYMVLSRRGFAVTERSGYSLRIGFFFLAPEDTIKWRRSNYALVRFYYPLIQFDNLIGTGFPIGCEPTWELSGFKASRSDVVRQSHRIEGSRDKGYVELPEL